MRKKIVNKEPKEGTGSGSSGGFEANAFLMWSDDEEAKKEYKRMEGEFKEATSSSSVGAYDASGFEDVNMRGNNPVGRGKQFRKPLYKGGGFVTFKKKCKTFPYCSQGDSKDKPVRVKKKLSPISEAIENVAYKTGLSVEEIKEILIKKFNGKI